ncbi:putative trans-sialidase-like protein [Diaporthe ampelina]|uniref:Putative trans-sialidase-like protein n=1 Tax=Diaporthe ampelina TaxID=1214573 RepID=A0A0G2FD13_9PEZI|nr:putative trans-sialidase-like protein [Diaporthe ampelina]
MSGPPPPPPPPPHGESPKTTSGSGSGLPPGKYDVFIIPEHSAGSGFLYLPSLRTNTNSFIAGFASALIMVVLGQSMAPAFQAWWANFQGMGNAGMLLLVIAAETPKNSWQKARDEVRRKEEERKAKEAEEKRRAEAAQRLKELREKEARERAQREAERIRREQEAKEKLAQEQAARDKEAKEKEDKERKEKEQREARERELRERLAREREERRRKLEEDRRRREDSASQARSTSSYAYSGVGEKTSPWPNGKPPTPSSPTKKPPPPTAKTFVGDDSDTHSYRPYDQPKRPARRMSKSDMSESSWAPSQSTARTSPPPSVRGPYSTKDPDKIVIKAVYCFMNQFAKTPASQLISGVGTVTDGLILRITTEGLFIDDDIRGVAQREWDVKAWTLKMVEVVGGGARLRAAERGSPKSLSGDEADGYLADVLRSCKDSCRLGDCASKFAASNLPASSGYNDDASSVTSGSTRVTDSTAQTGDWKAKGLHLLRATIRDQEGKRYMFVIGEEDGWKVAVGLQRLRRGTQVRALGVAGLSGLETKSTLEMLGWG